MWDRSSHNRASSGDRTLAPGDPAVAELDDAIAYVAFTSECVT